MKKYIIIAGIVIALILIGWLYFSLKKTQDKLQIANVELSVANDSVSVYRSKTGDLSFKIKSAEIERDNLKESLEITGLNLKELRQKDINWRNIVLSLQAKLAISGHGETIIHDTVYVSNTDTIKAGKFRWSNKYLFLNGAIADKNMSFDYLYKSDISIIQTKDRRGTKIDLSLTDPNSSIVTGSSFNVIHKQGLLEKWWLTIPAGLVGGYLLAK